MIIHHIYWIYVLSSKQEKETSPDFLTFSSNNIQCGFNVFIRLMWRRDVRQRQIKVESKMCLSKSKFLTLNNVDSTLPMSTVILARLGNVKTMLLFSTLSFTTLINIETTLWLWPFAKNWKEQKDIFELKEKRKRK